LHQQISNENLWLKYNYSKQYQHILGQVKWTKDIY
jgi:hypothetical protein